MDEPYQPVPHQGAWAVEVRDRHGSRVLPDMTGLTEERAEEIARALNESLKGNP